MLGSIGSNGGPNRSALSTIIKAGDGEVCSIQHALRHGVDFVIMEVTPSLNRCAPLVLMHWGES
jgi:hypothetical protein